MSDGRQTHELGVLFVHGIGFQQRGETLLGNGETLVETLEAWLVGDDEPPGPGETPLVEIRETTLRPADDVPAHSQVLVRPATDVDPQSWLLAESWWSQSFETPSFGDLLWWFVLVAPVTVAFHAHGRIGQAFTRLTLGAVRDHERRFSPHRDDPVYGAVRGGAISWWRMLELLFEAVVFALSLMLVPVVLVVLAALLAVGVLPNDRARRLVLAAQRQLTGSVGDSFVFLRSPLQNAAIMSRVRQDLAWLTEHCERVAVVAHSQGAAVTHGMLRRLPPAERPALLVTYGSGLKKLSDIREIHRADRRVSAKAGLLMGGLITLAVGVMMLYPRLSVASDAGAWRVLGLLALAVVTMWAVAIVTASPEPVMSTVGVSGSQDRPPPRWVPRIVLTALLAAVLPLLLPAADRVAGWVTLAGLAVTLNGIGLLRPPVRIAPERLRLDGLRWIDVHTTHDPVPNGAILETYDDVVVESLETTNRWSTLLDHTTYWANRDAFVVLVASALLLVAELPVPAGRERPTDPARMAVASYRRRWRCRALGAVRMLGIVVTALVALAGWSTTWPAVGREVAVRTLDLVDLVPFVTVSWTPNPRWQRAIGVLVAVGLVTVGQLLVVTVWKAWDRADTTRFLRRQDFHQYEPWGVAFYVTLAAAALGGVIAAALMSPWRPDGLGVVLLLGGSFVAVWFFVHGVPGREWWFRWARAGTVENVLGTRADFLRGQLWAVDDVASAGPPGRDVKLLLTDPALYMVRQFHLRRISVVLAIWSREGLQLVRCVDAIHPRPDSPERRTIDEWLDDVIERAAIVHRPARGYVDRTRPDMAARVRATLQQRDGDQMAGRGPASGDTTPSQRTDDDITDGVVNAGDDLGHLTDPVDDRPL